MTVSPQALSKVPDNALLHIHPITLCLHFFFYGAGNGTQGLTQAKQMLLH
jgi:hypothetical protein